MGRHPDALYNLGIFSYNGGEGIEQDHRAAFIFFENASTVGHSEALFSLWALLQYGHGVTKDDHKAVELYQKAADKGHANAPYNLGLYYYYGEGGLAKDLNRRKAYSNAPLIWDMKKPLPQPHRWRKNPIQPLDSLFRRFSERAAGK